MKRTVLLIMLLLLGSVLPMAAQEVNNVCRVEEGKMIFTLDKTWTAAQQQKVIREFNLDSDIFENAFSGKAAFSSGNQQWQVKQIDSKRVEISRPFGKSRPASPAENVIFVDDRYITAEGLNKRTESPYGVNKFTRYSVFNYSQGNARFFFPGKTDASQVYLSGTFNNWSTLETPMQKTDSGWVVTLRLKPGKYLYKYIVDGRWTEDSFNRQKEDDLNGGYNSVLYCYNYRFFLGGYPDAKKVYLAGSFNGWYDQELLMIRVKGGWALNLFLREGTHAYKFIVDGNWILDPANPIKHPDGDNHMNSFVGIGDTVLFRYSLHTEKNLCALSGNFNAWNANELFMTKTEKGWELPYVLAPGNYEYKFVLDGTWITDPGNPFVVYSGGETNSLKVVRPNHVFVLQGYTDAKSVIVTGSFNDWSTKNYRMVLRNHEWVLPIRLGPGKHQYKFIVDNKWIEDPVNDQWEYNQYGTKNSVLWIEPGR